MVNHFMGHDNILIRLSLSRSDKIDGRVIYRLAPMRLYESRESTMSVTVAIGARWEEI
jgi:hypothetical protein